MSELSGRLAIAVAAVCSSALAYAQDYSFERHRLLPQESLPTPFAAAGDLDGDGDVDLVVVSSGFLGGAAKVLRNDGEGRFTLAESLAPIAGAPLALGDIDGDGDLDVAVGGTVGFGGLPTSLFRNDGPAGFTNVSTQWPTTPATTRDLLFVDYDRDGDQDIVACNPNVGQQMPVGQPQPINRLYLNNGSGVFTDVTAVQMPNPSRYYNSVTAGDLDGDADIDLVFISAWTSAIPSMVRVFLQDAQGVAVETPNLVPTVGIEFSDVALTDHDLDGDLDIAVASMSDVQLFTNDGSGAFTLFARLADPWIQKWTPADVDGDGRVDLLAVRWRPPFGQPMPLRFYRNTAAGFVDATSAQVEGADLGPSVLLAFDCDGDNDLDLWGATSPQPTLWHNDAQGRLLQIATRDLCGRTINFVAADDIDGDGDMDVAGIEMGEYAPSQLFVAENEGNGPVATKNVILPWGGVHDPACLALVDADLDGDKDIFVGSNFDMLFHNVGGTFVDVTAGHLPPLGGAMRVATGDVDGDGTTDIVTAGWPGHLYLGNGVGGFVNGDAAIPAAGSTVYDVALLDWDLDGDLDLAQALSWWSALPVGFRLLRNDWPAPFVDVTGMLGIPALQASSVRAIDIDRDGRQDLLVGHLAGSGMNGLLLFRSVPAGFVDETALRVPPTAAAGRIVVVDLDGDGWDDVCCRNQSDDASAELHNVNGVLTPFAPWVGFFGGRLPAQPVAFDFDTDGDTDVVQTMGTLRNRLRDLQDAVPPRVGRRGELVLHAHDGDGVNWQIALLAVSAARANPPLQFGSLGTLQLDPGTLVLHSYHVFPLPSGEVAVPYVVPNQTSLLGTSLFTQALFAHQPNPATWRLSNLAELRIRL